MEEEQDLPSSSNIDFPSTSVVTSEPPPTTNEATPAIIRTSLLDAVRIGRIVESNVMSPTGVIDENNEFKKIVRLPLENVTHKQADSTSDSLASLNEVYYENQVTDFQDPEAEAVAIEKSPPPPPPPTPSE